jgi:Arc/MetJ-type ribon-helix-helix transcriptional regulator
MSPTTKPRGKGRPSKGIGEKYRQVSLYLPPELLEDLDSAADLLAQKTGHHTNRTDVIRGALTDWLKRNPPRRLSEERRKQNRKQHPEPDER